MSAQRAGAQFLPLQQPLFRTASLRAVLYCIHWAFFGGTWLVHMYIARFNKVLQLRYRERERERDCALHPPSHPPLFSRQLPYNWLSWLVRVIINLIVVGGNALSMLALFFLSLASFGDNVASQVREPRHTEGKPTASRLVSDPPRSRLLPHRSATRR